ncbi:MAG: energy transducer TonB [Rhodoferax sp.]|uniref:energy transducer TonB n=1 Tax=Rhodoferax sp. TaxID=50421 RepID=UPI003BB01658
MALAPIATATTTPGAAEKASATGVTLGAHGDAAALALTLTAPSASPAPTTVVLPSTNADYLNNPAPVYPAISRRLGEEGKVVIRVLIDKDGKPQQGHIGQSSGHHRLDQAALRAVMAWRYVPGRRDGTAQDMWFNVPIHFALQ